MALLVWGLLAACGGYWLIQLLAKPLAAPANALQVAEQRGGPADLTRLFGAAPVQAPEAAPVAESRFKLIGVVAPKNPRLNQTGEGVALIAVDGIARTVRVGAPVDGGLQLLAVDSRSARLGQGGVVTMSLLLAPPTAATTGALAPAMPSPTILGGNLPQAMPPQQQLPQQPPQPQQPQQPPNGPGTPQTH